MYDKVVTRMRIIRGQKKSFSHYYMFAPRMTLCLYLFALVIDALNLLGHIQEKIPWCMLFVDYIILVDGAKKGITSKIERWREVLKSKGFKISIIMENFEIKDLLMLMLKLLVHMPYTHVLT